MLQRRYTVVCNNIIRESVSSQHSLQNPKLWITSVKTIQRKHCHALWPLFVWLPYVQTEEELSAVTIASQGFMTPTRFTLISALRSYWYSLWHIALYLSQIGTKTFSKCSSFIYIYLLFNISKVLRNPSGGKYWKIRLLMADLAYKMSWYLVGKWVK